MTFFRLLLLTATFFLLPISYASTGPAPGPQSPVPANLKNSIRSVRTEDGRKLIALTFDLCEGPRETSGFDSGIVDFLKANHVKATFFAGGKWMRSHPEQTMLLMREERFEIGNHSWSHANFRLLGPAEAEDEVTGTQRQYGILREELEKRLNLEGGAEKPPLPARSIRVFRFPYGTCTNESLALLAELGLPAIQWDIVSGDAAPGRSARGITATVLSNVKPGSIIIFHANGKGRSTLEALRELVPKLRDRGFEFAAVSELLAAGTPAAVSECYELRPGDNLRYDRLDRRKKHGRN